MMSSCHMSLAVASEQKASILISLPVRKPILTRPVTGHHGRKPGDVGKTRMLFFFVCHNAIIAFSDVDGACIGISPQYNYMR